MSHARRGPVTDDEALATLQDTIRSNNERRIARYESRSERSRDQFTDEEIAELGLRKIPSELPDLDDLDARELFSFRVPTAALARVRARAAIENHRGIASVIMEAFTAYADHAPGTTFTMTVPPFIADEFADDEARADTETDIETDTEK